MLHVEFCAGLVAGAFVWLSLVCLVMGWHPKRWDRDR